MNKSIEKIRDIKALINEVYDDRKCQGELTEGARKSWLCFKQYCDDIKQDLELLEQLKQQRDSLAINNGELCVKVTDLEKAFDKACERLDYDCPVGINLIDDLDCENCCDDIKKC